MAAIRKYFEDSVCLTPGCDEQAYCLDYCSACYQWRRSRIARLTDSSDDLKKYLFRRVNVHFSTNVDRVTLRRKHNGRRLRAVA